jgi:hypothetical protein
VRTVLCGLAYRCRQIQIRIQGGDVMKLIYVAGPYRAPTTWERDRNIQAAREVGATVARLGAYPVIPHSNTSHMDGLCDDQFWLDGTLELMRRCDGMLLVVGWNKSSGTRGEMAEAERLHIPTFQSVLDLRRWLQLVEAGTALPGQGELPANLERDWRKIGRGRDR